MRFYNPNASRTNNKHSDRNISTFTDSSQTLEHLRHMETFNLLGNPG